MPRQPRRAAAKRSKKSGLPPGTPVHTGEVKSERTILSVLDYDNERLTEKQLDNADECASYLGRTGVTWINVVGLAEVSILERLGAVFKLHPLIVEDVVNTDQRPKLEDYGDVLFIVIRVLAYGDDNREVSTEQVSLILGANFVLSFEERESPLFNTVRERIRQANGRVRQAGPDYLMYRLMDTIVDRYFEVLEKVGEEIEFIEDQIVEKTTPDDLREIHRLRRQMIFLRKAVWPLREVAGRCQHGESALIQAATAIFFRDVYDHIVQAIDAIETDREMLSDMLDMYLSSVNFRLNVVMKVLTVISTIFLPLTFLAGVWGMNFRWMPELWQPWGYPAALGLMFAIGLGMLWFFRRRGWM
jgi:magnesium transporter